MSGTGKRFASGPGPSHPAKRGPALDTFDDDMIDEAADFNDEDVPEAYWPDAEDDGAAAADPTLCEAGRNWLRPPVGNLQPGCDALGEHTLQP